MTLSVSPELRSLCQAQLQLLNRTLGPLSAIVYLAESLQLDASSFTPIASYPESSETWSKRQLGAVPSARRLPAPSEQATALEDPDAIAAALSNASVASDRIDSPASGSEDQVVMPLVYTDVVVGLMVVVREQRWEDTERLQIQQVADSVAAGCVLERRNHWLQQRLQHKRMLQGRQSEVFHNLLHQFRNPLTALATFGQLLRRRLQADDPNYSVAEGIVRESQRLKALLSDFDETVDLGDVELQEDLQTPAALPSAELAGEPPALLPSKGLGRTLLPTAQLLSEVLAPLVAVTQAVAQEQQIHLLVDVDSAPVSVVVDTQALQEVLSNLLDNAFKYSSPAAWVWLQTGFERTTEAVTYQGIVVGDTGAGIPPEDQARLFERHYRGVQATGSIPGTGLGLAIAQELITQMQGQIEVISPVAGTDWVPAAIRQQAAAGPGTAFVIWIPVLSESA
ncbi:MAG: HAMP domain-containing histidine kinase [Leptolyngbya sp. SIO4C1]|nr:HAMP domain-containing histidine kinase [Leptolyngbya sp. SIO4C1]